MLIKNIIPLINAKLAGELLTYKDLQPFMDNVIDDINAQLNTIYPAFSELGSFDVDYNMFPDRFIRSVVVPGAAWYFFVADEEGSPTAQQLAQDYQRGLFLMLRDMLYNIPVQYQADSLQGTVNFDFTVQQGIEFDNTLGELGEW